MSVVYKSATKYYWFDGQMSKRQSTGKFVLNNLVGQCPAVGLMLASSKPAQLDESVISIHIHMCEQTNTHQTGLSICPIVVFVLCKWYADSVDARKYNHPCCKDTKPKRPRHLQHFFYRSYNNLRTGNLCNDNVAAWATLKMSATCLWTIFSCATFTYPLQFYVWSSSS